jgi:hypothetical protein
MAVLIPDIIRGPFLFLSETRAEEIAIFLLGTVSFLIFIRNELQLVFHRKEKEKDRKKIDQTVKDLVESYSYIGEVNRKMDILMNIALGISDRSMLNKKRERDIYESITSATNFLMKAESVSLRFINLKTKQTEKEFKTSGKQPSVKNVEMMEIKDRAILKKEKNCIVIASAQEINGIRSFLIINNYDENEETNPKNIEIIKVFASQSLFLFSYVNQDHLDCSCDTDKKEEEALIDKK